MQKNKMEKQILIPIILVLGLLTCGIGIYLYIRCRNKPIEALEEVVVQESKESKKDQETSIDNTTNISYDNTIPVDDVEVVEEKKEDITDLVLEYQSNLTQETERQLVFIDDELQTLGEMRAGCADMRAGCADMRAGCAEIVEAGNGFIQAGKAFIAHCDNMIQSYNNSIVFGTLALGMSAVSVGDETNENNLNVG